MWILKNSTSLLSSLDQLDVRTAKSVQTFDFSTLYTSIPHDLLKSKISNLVHNAFRKKDGSVRYAHIKLTRAKGYFTHDINGGGDNMFTADSICEMIEFLIDNIFVQFGVCLFRQVIGIPMGTNCAPLLADLFLYSYENEFNWTVASYLNEKYFKTQNKIYTDKGSPCLVHRSIERYSVEKPLFITQLLTLKRRVLIHLINSSPKPNLFNDAKIKLCSTESNAFSISAANSTPSVFSCSVWYSMSSIKPIDSPMNLLFTQAVWSEIRFGKTCLSLNDSAFDAI